MSKPFSYLHEAPQMLHDLGLLLGGLHLGKGMTVLDFGAGTCWLSRLLAQLNCAPICCDVSASALAIGQRLFADHPLIGTTVYQPTFLHFDGRHLDLPDASVDRIVCFDAFHHIPNQEEVMAQFGRVLKDGGVAAFSEPGREHSRSPQSQYEMRHHHVLENDIDLNAIFRMAQTVGFTDMSVHVLSDLSLSLEEYNVVFGQRRDEALRDRAWDHMHDAMFNRSVFFLRKGDLHRDSRSHDGLAHRLTVDRQDVTTAVGVPVGLTFTIENAGTATWIHEGREIFGLVRLASHLAEADGRLLSIDYTRHALPVAVQPGEQVSLTVDVPMPGPGRYLLTFDLVAEGVTWFENVGCTAIEVRVAVV
jgi:SAM-dependent methyltransferase